MGTSSRSGERSTCRIEPAKRASSRSSTSGSGSRVSPRSAAACWPRCADFVIGWRPMATTFPRSLLSLLLLMGAARTAEAHFVLLDPPSWTNENGLGDPQKDTPCGGEGGTPTGVVTTFRAGETITVRWRETIYHPGHWRIALSDNRADFVDPIVSVDNNGVSTGATIQDPPVAPVLLDGLFPRSGGGSSGTTFEQEITLPNEPCAS